MSDFIRVNFNIFGKYRTFDAWDAAMEAMETRPVTRPNPSSTGNSRPAAAVTGRHKELSAEELELIEEEKDEANTKKATKWALFKLDVFEYFCRMDMYKKLEYDVKWLHYTEMQNGRFLSCIFNCLHNLLQGSK